MANTYTALHCHVVFATKYRRPWIKPDIEERVWSYLGGIARSRGVQPLVVGGFDDHVHLLLGFPPTLCPSDALKCIKGRSSAWIKVTFSNFGEFAWQDGFSAFSVSKSGIPRVVRYIRNQREHHRTCSFLGEVRALLERHDIAFEERYILQ